MNTIQHSAAAVPPAQAGTITDSVLAATIDAAARANAGELNDHDGALLLLVALPALQELAQWRQKGALIAALANPGNVIHLPGARR